LAALISLEGVNFVGGVGRGNFAGGG